MSQERIPELLIIEKIRHCDTRFDLDAKDLHLLKEAGVSNDVVVAMLRTEDRGCARGNRDRYWRPYYSPWYLGPDFDFYALYHPGYASIWSSCQELGNRRQAAALRMDLLTFTPSSNFVPR
jgi:hypothetical protein